MNIDFSILWQIALLVIGGLITAIGQKYFDRRPRLVTFYGHTSVHQLSGDKPIIIHTHSVVVRNVGRAPATNVRLSHRTNPMNVYVDPPCSYRRELVNNAGDDLVFEKLIPGQQIAVSYLYYPPLVFSNFNSGIRSDEGFARPVSVIPQQQEGKRTIAMLTFLVVVGALTLAYFLLLGIGWLWLNTGLGSP